MIRSSETMRPLARILFASSLLLLAAAGGRPSWQPVLETLFGKPSFATEPRVARERRGAQPVGSGHRAARIAGALGPAPTVAEVVEPVLDGPAPRIEIARRSKVATIDPLLARAYAALRQGDTPGAEAAYDATLKSDPHSRDARLGLAAIAMRRGGWDEAAGWYVDVLRLDPRDSVAQAALISLQRAVDPVAGESRLKLLLQREPDAAYVHFALGTVFAVQGRWPEAQASFLTAYRLDADNPDYAYNLAVSLDRVARKRSAQAYYHRALDLAERRYAGFDPGIVLGRIRTLEAQGIVP